MSDLFDPQQIVSLEMRDFLGQYISTGSPVLDLIVGCLVFRLILYASNMAAPSSIASFNSMIFDWLKSLFGNYGLHKGQLEFDLNFGSFTGSIKDASSNVSPGFSGLLHKLSKIEDDRVWKLRESTLQSVLNSFSGEYDYLYEVCQDGEIEVEKGVWVKVVESEQTHQNRKGVDLKIVQKKLILYSDTYDAAYLMELTAKWLEEFENFKKCQLHKNRLVFQVRFDSKFGKDNNSIEPVYTEFHTHRSFDNLYFENKEIALKELNFFLDQRQWYEARGLPYTLGILCYGDPGCGKTSFIKALLRHTNRHAVLFSINRFTDLETIDKLIKTEEISSFPVPQNERVYIMEDIDAMGDLVKKRQDDSKKTKKTEEIKEQDMLDMVVGGFGKQKRENHLGFLLNILDGVIEHPGRIVIMTTNFVEKLDPALIRPGRIDLKLEFKRCTRKVMKQIISQFFDLELVDWELPEEIEDYLIAPSRVTQLCRGCKNNFQKFLPLLVEEAKREKGKKKGNSGNNSVVENTSGIDERSALSSENVAPADFSDHKVVDGEGGIETKVEEESDTEKGMDREADDDNESTKDINKENEGTKSEA